MEMYDGYHLHQVIFFIMEPYDCSGLEFWDLIFESAPYGYTINIWGL